MTIKIKNLRFKAIIGILPFEREMEQSVVIDSKIHYNLASVKGGCLEYIMLVERMKGMMIKNKYHLLEDAINEILNHFMASFPAIYAMKLRITKVDIYKDCEISVEDSIKRG